MLPIFTTTRILARQPTVHDAPAIFAYACQEVVTEFTQWQAHASLEDTYQFIRTIQQELKHIWVLEHVTTQTIIGECGFIIRDKQSIEIHCTLAPAWWGQGLAFEALQDLINLCFEQLHYQEIHAWTVTDNIRSQRLIKKLGMTHAQTIAHAWYAQNSLHAIDMYTLHHAQWLKNKSSIPHNTSYHSWSPVQHTQSE